MTTRLVLGLDPGVTGALALLVDGRFGGVWDLPMRARRTGHQELDGYQLGSLVRGILAEHPGACCTAVLEEVNAHGPKREGKALVCQKCGQPSGHVEEAQMGATSAFQFGRGAGGLQTGFEVLGIAVAMVTPAKWKKQTGLPGGREHKDYSRTTAVQCYPAAADYLKLKKHSGRAEALLIARWGDCHLRLGQAVTAAFTGTAAPFELTAPAP